MVGFGLSDLEANYFEEVISDDETEVDGRPARRITRFDDLEAVDAYPACGVRIEVEPGVILEVEVNVGQTEHYSTEDQPRLAEACAILDVLVPKVSARIAGGDGPPSADEGDAGDGDGDGATASTVPASAEVTSDLVRLWYTSSDLISPDDTALETDGRRGAIVPADNTRQCQAFFARTPGTVAIELARVDDACGVALELARLLAPRFPQSG